MDKYEYLGVIGQGSYGKVLKCRHKESGQMVAIKKFIETEEDLIARKMALREIRMLKKLKHDNLVNLLEVFRRKKRFHLVFEYIAETLLDKFEKSSGLAEDITRKYTYQIVRALDFCHSNNIVHRDLKPENVLVSDNNVIKLCDFGFARVITVSQEPFTDYVATRWYRAPELLVGEPQYGRAVDIWALGTLIVEMLTTEPLFAGDSDIDQLHRITKIVGNPTDKQVVQLSKSLGNGVDMELIKNLDDHPGTAETLHDLFPFINKRTIDIVAGCLKMDPLQRLRSDQLLTHAYFTWDSFPCRFLPELKQKIAEEEENRPKIKKIPCPPPAPRTFQVDPVTPTPSSQKFDWKVEFLPQEPPCITQSDIINVVNLGGKSSSSIHARPLPNKDEDEESELTNLPTPVYARKRCEYREEEKSSLLRNSKLMARYRREMMPQTLRIVPINGRLMLDEPGNRDYLFNRKPSVKDFCLPELPGSPKKRRQEPFVAGSCFCVPLVTRSASTCPLCNPLPEV